MLVLVDLLEIVALTVEPAAIDFDLGDPHDEV
jgi:hypothetical protein